MGFTYLYDPFAGKNPEEYSFSPSPPLSPNQESCQSKFFTRVLCLDVCLEHLSNLPTKGIH